MWKYWLWMIQDIIARLIVIKIFELCWDVIRKIWAKACLVWGSWSMTRLRIVEWLKNCSLTYYYTTSINKRNKQVINHLFFPFQLKTLHSVTPKISYLYTIMFPFYPFRSGSAIINAQQIQAEGVIVIRPRWPLLRRFGIMWQWGGQYERPEEQGLHMQDSQIRILLVEWGLADKTRSTESGTLSLN